jgi:hypothetical protein
MDLYQTLPMSAHSSSVKDWEEHPDTGGHHSGSSSTALLSNVPQELKSWHFESTKID